MSSAKLLRPVSCTTIFTPHGEQRGSRDVGNRVTACRHWASLHVVPRPSATFYELDLTGAQPSPSFSLLLFTPYPSHLIPTPLIPSPLTKEAPTQLADGEQTALSVDDIDRLAALYAKQCTTVCSLKADGHEVTRR
ncbi:BZ3500_MvSof-1268-A1-R1_Chr3-1g05561 [Microbotryum saponariae]|uniref:BZ3500_MvSof-1268-A1-R1_Chr3-1g05561 protein n=1 Tax=Microbotryum saponariae TaxID=289078 RepID=A0A2X0LIB3_9BASI|nr:BZ3500_MvSof-1268-A1-R1_Chr3-1g05561 [Microbotryum saponariae]